MTDLSNLVTKPEPTKVITQPIGVPETPAPKQPEKLTLANVGGLKISKVTEKAAFLNILLYGESGAGKTVLAGSASAVLEMSPVLVLDVEGGVEPLRVLYPDVDVVRIRSVKDLQNVYNDLFSKPHPYKTIVLDSLTEIQKVYMGEIMVGVYKADSDRDPDVPGMWEYNKNSAQMRKLVRAFRDLPVNTIFTALAEQREVNNLMKTVPSFTAKLVGEIPAIVDLVLYYYTKTQRGEIKRFLLTQKTEKEVAKDRTTKLPVVVEEPTFSLIHQIINS